MRRSADRSSGLNRKPGVRVQHFCYPNGTLADFTQAAVDMVRDSGFTTAVTAIHGVNTVERTRSG